VLRAGLIIVLCCSDGVEFVELTKAE